MCLSSKEEQDDYLESKGINIEGTNICRGLDLRQLHEAVVGQDLADSEDDISDSVQFKLKKYNAG